MRTQHSPLRTTRLALACLVGLLPLAPTFAEAVRVDRGVTYGEAGGEPLLLDVYQPADAARVKRPAVVLIHGGGWHSGDRRKPLFEKLARTLADAQYVAFSIDYRLVQRSPDGQRLVKQYPAAIDDCRQAVRWIRAHAEQYGIDGKRLGACGGSAGGHLAALLGTTDAASTENGEDANVSSRVQAVANFYGPTDFTQDLSGYRGRRRTTQQLVDDFLGDRSNRQSASPLLHIDDRTAAFLTLHGSQDKIIPVEQSRAFHEALVAAGGRSEYVELPKEGHGFSPEALPPALAKVVAFFDRELKGAANIAPPDGTCGLRCDDQTAASAPASSTIKRPRTTLARRRVQLWQAEIERVMNW